MKFLSKSIDSEVIKQNLRYQKGSKKNITITKFLLKEQYNFCAYSEKYFDCLDSVELEHFNSTIKYTEEDSYFNYYAVIRGINLLKKDEHFIEAANNKSSFFKSLFFQNQTELSRRIKYKKGEFIFKVTDESDLEAKDFLDFLAINDEKPKKDRERHIKRLQDLFKYYSTKEKQLDYFRAHHNELKFITTIENEFDLDLSEFYTQQT